MHGDICTHTITHTTATAHTHTQASKQAHTQTRTHARTHDTPHRTPHARTHARMHARTRTHARKHPTHNARAHTSNSSRIRRLKPSGDSNCGKRWIMWSFKTTPTRTPLTRTNQNMHWARPNKTRTVHRRRKASTQHCGLILFVRLRSVQ